MFLLIFFLITVQTNFTCHCHELVVQQGGMESDDIQSEISRINMLIQDEDLKMERYKVRETTLWLRPKNPLMPKY